MNLRLIDWIWNVRGSLALSPGQSSDEAFDRLYPLFSQPGTSHQRTNDTVSFRKKDQAAQDRMSVFDGGALRIENSVAGSVLQYHLTSRALLFCFLAPLLFLAIAQFTVVVDKFDKPPHEAAKENAVMPMNPIDKALGAPRPLTRLKRKMRARSRKPRSLPPRLPMSLRVSSSLFMSSAESLKTGWSRRCSGKACWRPESKVAS